MSNDKKIALLIDCDNVSYKSIEGVLSELAKFGKVNVRHAHGDWKSPSLNGWADNLHAHAIRPMQQFAYSKGKNATDSAMIIDAMDLLYSGNVDAFALMTSDSDFTPLVLRILENGYPVYGFGEMKTPKPFVASCTPFIFTENLENQQSDEENEVIPDTKSTGGKKAPNENPVELQKRKAIRSNTQLIRQLRNAAEQTAEDDGWSLLGSVGTYLSNNGSFSTINYGFGKLSSLIRSSDLFEIQIRNETAMYIRDLRNKS